MTGTGILLTLSKYVLVAIMVFYMIGSFAILSVENPKRLKASFIRQIILVLLFHAVGYAVLLAHEMNWQMGALYISELLFLILYTVIFRTIYPNSSRVILSHMLMFLAISFVILARLNFGKCLRQFVMVLAAGILSFFIPVMFRRMKWARFWSIFTGVIGALLLIVVLAFSSKTYGANLSINLGFFSFQPSEFVKISFVLLMAILFRDRNNLKRVFVTAIIAAFHVLILVWSTDLGGALIYAVTYLFILYAATSKKRYLIIGILCAMAAAVAAYFLFGHVRTRVQIWLDPWPTFSGKGNQVCNSLLGIANGGLLGTGLFRGNPGSIPIVEKDFIFSAISEELGGIVALCLILCCVSCLFKFIQVASRLYLPFYRLTGIGLATIYGVQTFLAIGGNIKFIPATGVTLPLVSYGGSSIISTFILFAIMQELFIKRRREEEVEERYFSGENMEAES